MTTIEFAAIGSAEPTAGSAPLQRESSVRLKLARMKLRSGSMRGTRLYSDSPGSARSHTSSITRQQSTKSDYGDYKIQKQNYRDEKKRVEKELLHALKDPTVVVMADWLKVRGTLRKWVRLYTVLKPGILILYKSEKIDKYGYWVGTVLLNSCELIERPSKKNGFCFKLFHPLDQSIWSTRGPHGEAIPAVTMPLPSSHLICRAVSEEAGQSWMDALELALRCSSLLLRTMNRELHGQGEYSEVFTGGGSNHVAGSFIIKDDELVPALNLSETDRPRSRGDMHVHDGGPENGHASTSELNDARELRLRQGSRSARAALSYQRPTSSNNHPGAIRHGSDTLDENGHSLKEDDSAASTARLDPNEAEKHFSFDEEESDSDEGELEVDLSCTNYVKSPPEVFAPLNEYEQTEEFADENKSLIWTLMKQVRPGMDLSKVVLPTFILEPRSFLEKFADYYFHVDLLDEAVNENDPFKRMKAVVRFYLSGFYKKPKGLKKPYNPILGELFRCFWQHDDGSKTFYISEQVSHHPPVSSFYVSNRQKGYNIAGTILAKSKFYGNSLSALLLGNVQLSLLDRGETYLVTLPYAHCKGLILGTLTMELGGTAEITCERTGYSASLEFKLKPLFGGGEAMNVVQGKIKLGKQTLADIEGHWDSSVVLTDRQSGEPELLWQPSQSTIQRRLQRHEVPIDTQDPFESQRLWIRVTEALALQDQYLATEQKTVVEEAQRRRAKELKERAKVHVPRLFAQEDSSSPGCSWIYIHADYRPWDSKNDLEQFENEFILRTRSVHRAPLVHGRTLDRGKRHSRGAASSSIAEDLCAVPALRRSTTLTSESSHDDDEQICSLGVRPSTDDSPLSKAEKRTARAVRSALEPLQGSMEDVNTKLVLMQMKIDKQKSSQHGGGQIVLSIGQLLLLLLMFTVMQAGLVLWCMKSKFV